MYVFKQIIAAKYIVYNIANSSELFKVMILWILAVFSDKEKVYRLTFLEEKYYFFDGKY